MRWDLLRAFWVPLQAWFEWIVSSYLAVMAVTLLPQSFRTENTVVPMVGTALVLAAAASLYRARKRRCWLDSVQPKTELSSLAGYAGALLPPFLLIVLTVTGAGSHRARVRQSEAKIALAAIYGAQGEHYKKHGRNSWSFDELGYQPEGHRRFYTIGFPPHCAPGVARLLHGANNTVEKGRESEAADWFESLRGQPCDDPVNGYTAYAVGIIRTGGQLDIWRIDAEKRLVNLQDGTRKKSGWFW